MANPIYQPFIIIGMHRSGTTLLANALNNAGVFMGVFRDHNGEALHFLSLNQQMLWADSANWLEPRIPVTDKTLAPLAIYAEHIKATTSSKWRLELLKSRKWGWKDPRNTFTLPLWLKRFPNAKVIHVIRDGRAVALSLANRNKTAGEVHDERLDNLNFNFKLWEKYVEQGRSYSTLSTQYLEVKYEDLVGHSVQEINRINHFTGCEISNHLHVTSRKSKAFPPEIDQLAQNSEVFKMLGYTI